MEYNVQIIIIKYTGNSDARKMFLFLLNTVGEI